MTVPPALTRSQVLAWRNALFVIFGLCGIVMASWASRIPAVKLALHASTSQMGLLLFGIAAGSILGLLASSHVIARLGARHSVGWAVSIGAVGFALAGVGRHRRTNARARRHRTRRLRHRVLDLRCLDEPARRHE